MFQRSERIQAFLSTYDEADWFLDFIHQVQPYDAQKDLTNGDNYDDFDHAFELGKKAGNKTVFECEVGDGMMFLYFLGKEDDILAHLKTKVVAWLKTHPQDAPEAKALARLRESKMQAEKQLKSLQASLVSLEQQKAQLLESMPKKRSRKKKA